MNRKISYEDCLGFIEHRLHIKLYDFQKDIIKCFCEGREVRTCRGAGRSMCADAFGKYIAHLYDRNDYSVDPEVAITYQELIRNRLLDANRIEEHRALLSSEVFDREYCCR